jgi:hypothetical protein
VSPTRPRKKTPSVRGASPSPVNSPGMSNGPQSPRSPYQQQQQRSPQLQEARLSPRANSPVIDSRNRIMNSQYVRQKFPSTISTLVCMM